MRGFLGSSKRLKKGVDLSQKMVVNRDMSTVEKIKLFWSKLTYFGRPQVVPWIRLMGTTTYN